MGKRKNWFPRIKPTSDELKLDWHNKKVSVSLSDGSMIVEPVRDLNHYVALKRFVALPGPSKKKKFRL